VAELQQQLDLALKEIEVMKESRQRQAEMVMLQYNLNKIFYFFLIVG
jgi:hypothetical protein